MKVPFLDLQAQYNSIKENVREAVDAVIEQSAFVKGAFVEEFEQRFANLIGIRHCIGVANGTDALMLAMKALEIGPGDEVIVPANSFIATSEAVTATGARVVFADCTEGTYTIDPERVRSAITPKTKALIAVHLYGQMAEMESLGAIARSNNLRIIEDAAQAHLAECRMADSRWHMAGTVGDISTFSFYPGKNLGAYGDAGCVVTNDSLLARKVSMMANHGRIAKYDHEFEGYNSRLDGLQAAILTVKLSHLSEWTEKRRTVASRYSELLAGIPQLSLPVIPENQKPVWHLYVIRTNQREELRTFLKKNGIETGVHYPIALPNLKAYKYLGHKPTDFPVASEYQSRVLSLPVYPELYPDQLGYVAECIREYFNQNETVTR